MRTTADWRALLDGATPGPWWDTSQCNVTAKEGLVAYVSNREGADPGEVTALSDATLIAAAPEAVAEVIRLRESIEKLAEHWQNLDTHTYQETTRPMTVSFSEAVKELQQILRGAA